MKPYSVKETVKSQLNIHIYNARGNKKRFFVSLNLNKDASKDIFPEQHKEWLLEEAGARKKSNGVFLNYAYYIRDLSDKEIEEAVLEEIIDDMETFDE